MAYGIFKTISRIRGCNKRELNEISPINEIQN
jgi:hypothetical protein